MVKMLRAVLAGRSASGRVLRITAGLVVGLAVAAACGSLASVADAEIYWDNVSANTIGEASNDGTHVNQSFIKGADGPADVVVYGQHIYWANVSGCTESGSCPGTIAEANLNGTGVKEDLATAVTPYGLTVVGQYIYWSNSGSNTIGRSNLNGTGANQNFIKGVSGPNGVAVNGQYVYWANEGTNSIGRANLDGTDVNTNFITGANAPEGIAIDSQYIYWVNHNGHSIGRASLNGTGVDQSFIPYAGSWPTRVTVDSQYIYWTTWTQNGVPSTGTIGRANLDGTDVDNNLIHSADTPVGVAVTAGSASPPSVTASVGRARLSGTTASVLVSCHGTGAAKCRVKLTLSVSVIGGKSIGASVTLTAGESTTVKLRLDGADKRLLSSHHTLKAKLVATFAGATISSQTVTFKERT